MKIKELKPYCKKIFWYCINKDHCERMITDLDEDLCVDRYLDTQSGGGECIERNLREREMYCEKLENLTAELIFENLYKNAKPDEKFLLEKLLKMCSDNYYREPHNELIPAYQIVRFIEELCSLNFSDKDFSEKDLLLFQRGGKYFKKMDMKFYNENTGEFLFEPNKEIVEDFLRRKKVKILKNKNNKISNKKCVQKRISIIALSSMLVLNSIAFSFATDIGTEYANDISELKNYIEEQKEIAEKSGELKKEETQKFYEDMEEYLTTDYKKDSLEEIKKHVLEIIISYLSEYENIKLSSKQTELISDVYLGNEGEMSLDKDSLTIYSMMDEDYMGKYNDCILSKDPIPDEKININFIIKEKSDSISYDDIVDMAGEPIITTGVIKKHSSWQDVHKYIPTIGESQVGGFTIEEQEIIEEITEKSEVYATINGERIDLNIETYNSTVPYKKEKQILLGIVNELKKQNQEVFYIDDGNKDMISYNGKIVITFVDKNSSYGDITAVMNQIPNVNLEFESKDI